MSPKISDYSKLILATKAYCPYYSKKQHKITQGVGMTKHKEGILPFKVVAIDEHLVARGGFVLAYELAKPLKLPKIIDAELTNLVVANDVSLS